MVAITATNSATPSLQSVLVKTRLDQARREANQAEANAQELQVQADAAENDARQSRSTLSDLSQRSQQADPTYQTQIKGSQFGLLPDTRYQATGRIVNLSA